MRKMKRLITLLMTVVMMMAMSITAFAAEADGTAEDVAKVTVEKLVPGTEVNIYEIAHITNNEIVVNDWASKAYDKADIDLTKNTDMYTYAMNAGQVAKIGAAFEAWTDKTVAATQQKANDEGVVEFTKLKAGIYYVAAKNIAVDVVDGETTVKQDTVYNPMVVVAIKNDGNGKYVANDAKVTAKGTTHDLKKTADDQFVKNGQEITFKIEKTIPRNVDKFIVYDVTENLSSLDGVKAKITIANDAKPDRTFKAVTGTTNKFEINFTDLVYDTENDEYLNDFAGDKLVIEYKATVVGNKGFENKASYSVKDNEEVGEHKVHGWTGTIVLAKYDAITEDGLNGAEFTVVKKGAGKNGADLPLTFKLQNDGKYILDATANDTLVTASVNVNGDDEEDTEGIIVLTGLDDGTYVFTETKAPVGYAINNLEEHSATITAAEKDQFETVNVADSKLVSLPFTGGMGTTIFTILGVAIMAMAAALFFATKKNHN